MEFLGVGPAIRGIVDYFRHWRRENRLKDAEIEKAEAEVERTRAESAKLRGEAAITEAEAESGKLENVTKLLELYGARGGVVMSDPSVELDAAIRMLLKHGDSILDITADPVPEDEDLREGYPDEE